MDVEGVARVLDRLGGGRQAVLRLPPEHTDHPRTSRALRAVAIGIGAAFALDLVAVVVALATSGTGAQVSGVVWVRLVMISLLTASLFYFVWRAARGWWWAYSRLRLFTVIFPVVAVGTCLVPGLYPTWMIVEQVALAVVLLGVAGVLNSRHMREAYAKPTRLEARPAAGPRG